MGIIEEKISQALGISQERVSRLLKNRTLRKMRYRNIEYVVLRRDLGEFYEGTVILSADRWNTFRIVAGYPHIKRILLLRRALQNHFIDTIVVEEKMDGHNVRVILYENTVLAITRGGYICPYTTSRMIKMYGDDLVGLLLELGEQGLLAGEVVGLENPYTRHYYPEAPDWGFFVFDAWKNGELLTYNERRETVSSYGLSNVPLLGLVDKENVEEIHAIVEKLSQRRREGVVLKDPHNRVEPLKYTTSYINIDDIRIGMEAPFDEGRHFLFPRILREAFRIIEKGGEDFDEISKRLGKAILEPFIASILSYIEQGRITETFRLTFYSHEDLEEFMVYYTSLGIDVVPVTIEKTGDGRLIVEAYKYKRETMREYRKILKTGLSPLD